MLIEDKKTGLTGGSHGSCDGNISTLDIQGYLT